VKNLWAFSPQVDPRVAQNPARRARRPAFGRCDDAHFDILARLKSF
jgi:hypothetical protein